MDNLLTKNRSLVLLFAGFEVDLRSIMAIVYKARNKKRAQAHGFLARKSTKSGKNVIARRRHKGRKRVVIG